MNEIREMSGETADPYAQMTDTEPGLPVYPNCSRFQKHGLLVSSWL